MYSRIDAASEKLGADYRKYQEEYEDEYLSLLEDNVEIFKNQINVLKNEYDITSNKLQELKQKTDKTLATLKDGVKEYFTHNQKA